MKRKLPNIIITGTPGTGKSTHCEQVVERMKGLMKHISVNQIVKDEACHEGWDSEFGCWIVDDDKLLDSIEDDVEKGACIIDWHACEVFPKRWIDLVVVLRVESITLYDRLKSRKCSPKKLESNMDSEIMEVLLQEARESYDEEIVVELRSDTTDELDSNVDRIVAWLEQWMKDHADGA